MEFGIAIPQTYPDTARIQRFLRRAEEMPFTAAWCIEQVIGTAPVLESVTTLAYAAAITKRLRLGIAVLLIAQRNPIDLAKSLSSVDVLSNGRLMVGVGLGASSRHYPAYGLATEGRVARFRENLEIINRLWTEDRVTFRGRFSQLDNIPMQPKPVQKPRPPVIVGGAFPHSARRALRYGDGWVPNASRPTYSDVTEFLPQFRQMAAEAGRDPASVPVTIFGSPDNLDRVKRYREQGIARVVTMLPSAPAAEVLPILDRWAALIRQTAH